MLIKGTPTPASVFMVDGRMSGRSTVRVSYIHHALPEMGLGLGEDMWLSAGLVFSSMHVCVCVHVCVYVHVCMYVHVCVYKRCVVADVLV
jgi:hypothetical protein